MFGTLNPVGGGDAIPLRKPKLIVGRRPSCDICLEYANVSSTHCEMEIVNGYWRVRDLNSSNGVKVNGVRVDEKFVQPGDTISFGKHHYEIDYTPDPSAAPVEEADPFAIGLLEKAGLGRSEDERPRRPNRNSTNGAAPKIVKPNKPAEMMDDDDRALEWMSDG
jgi:predicted component of type VI protein secretion system